jgi:hypothetical protein
MVGSVQMSGDKSRRIRAILRTVRFRRRGRDGSTSARSLGIGARNSASLAERAVHH